LELEGWLKKRKGSIFDALSLSAQTFCSQINTFQDKSQKPVSADSPRTPFFNLKNEKYRFFNFP
jgi:hypothetical protein